MNDTEIKLEESCPLEFPSMMHQAKESISRIEESTSRINDIVNGPTKPNVVRSHTRRRDDCQVDYIKHLLVVAVVSLIITLGGLVTYMQYELHMSNDIALLTAQVTKLEIQVQQALLPSQNLDSSQ